jgi:hypothetical protein
METLNERDLKITPLVTKCYEKLNLSTITDDVEDQFYDDVVRKIWNLGVSTFYISTLINLSEKNINYKITKFMYIPTIFKNVIRFNKHKEFDINENFE